MLKIRTACDKDVEGIFEVAEECRLEDWTEADYRRELTRSDALILVAAIENKVVGYIAARFSGMDELNDASKKGKSFSESDIINFGILEKYRHRGIGSKLLSEFIKSGAAKNIESVWLEVREQNSNAVCFYEKNGFVKTQIRNNFYTNPVDNAIIMKFEFRKLV